MNVHERPVIAKPNLTPTSHGHTLAMPLGLLNFALVCDGNELETYDVVQEDPNTIIASVASEAGKVSVPRIPW
jgi:hypothetical protein